VVQDGALLTGQNPASAAPLADALIGRLRDLK
jgi:putative intracellular protease/amidase